MGARPPKAKAMRDFQRVLLVFLGLLGGANGAAPVHPPASPRRSLLSLPPAPGARRWL